MTVGDGNGDGDSIVRLTRDAHDIQCHHVEALEYVEACRL